jgi:hypothetical protein
MSGIHLALLGMTYGESVTVIQSFTATGDWVCPTGVTEVEYLLLRVELEQQMLLLGQEGEMAAILLSLVHLFQKIQQVRVQTL